MMKLSRLVAFALSLLIAGGLGIAVTGENAPETTSAAWTDQTRGAAVATAGSWKVAPKNTCIAYGFNGEQIPGCAVTSVTFEGWGAAGRQVRNYYINFNVDPLVVRRVSFDVDLSTATGVQTRWSWTKAGVVAGGAQFTAREGWTCGELPRVRGTGADWQRPGLWFSVEEYVSGSPRLCS